MNYQDHIAGSLEIIFWVKILKIFDAAPGSGMEKIRIRDKHPGCATLVTSYKKATVLKKTLTVPRFKRTEVKRKFFFFQFYLVSIISVRSAPSK